MNVDTIENYEYLIVTGIGGCSTGTGRLVEYLDANNNGDYLIISLDSPYRDELIAISRKLRGQNIVILHPQKIGYDLVVDLIEFNNVFWYVLDNGFFCIQSYNHRKGMMDCCLDCLGTTDFRAATKHSCSSFPEKMQSSINIEFLKKIYQLKEKIVFLAQNEQQKELLKEHFGAINCFVVGLCVSDFSLDCLNGDQAEDGYDIVYHGHASEAKGFLFALMIAKNMPGVSFLFPVNVKNRIVDFSHLQKLLPNVEFKDITWDTGLSDEVRRAKVVLVPSLWSAPIEGALIKSMVVNGMVASPKVRFSHVSEINSDTLLFLDAHCLNSSISCLNEVLRNSKKRNEFRERAFDWVRGFAARTGSMMEDIKETVVASKVKRTDYIISLNDHSFSLAKSYEEIKNKFACDTSLNDLFCGQNNFIRFVLEVREDAKFAIFGSGERGKSILSLIQWVNQKYNKKLEILCFLDNDESKWGTEINGISVGSPQKKYTYSDAFVLLASSWRKELYTQLILDGVDGSVIINA